MSLETRVISMLRRLQKWRNPFLYRMLISIIQRLHFKPWSPEKCEEILESIYKDSHSTCKDKNTPSTNEYDLQIIVPVYNVENYLKECLDSIISQKTKYYFKVTIVNDGSTDQSLTIAKQYCQYENVEIINQKNKGLSGARNAGLARMCGRYVLFIDSDDRLPENAIEVLMDAATTHADMEIVVGGYSNIDQAGFLISSVESIDSFPNSNPIGYPWGKVMKSNIFENIKWPEKYWFEDVLVPLVLYTRFKVGSVSDSVYEYRRNPHGIVSSSWSNPKILDTFYITRSIVQDKSDKLISESYYDAFLRQVVLNKGRIATLANQELDKAVFFLTCNLHKKFFCHCSTQDTKLKLIECSLRCNNFILYSVES